MNGGPRRLERNLCWLAMASLVVVSGCGGGRGELSGKVTYLAKPIRMGTVLVAGKDGIVRSSAIKDDGSYSVADVPVGEVQIAVSSPEPGAGPIAAKEPRAPKPSGDLSKWLAIPEKYADFKQSELTFTVRKGTNHHDIELK